MLELSSVSKSQALGWLSMTTSRRSVQQSSGNMSRKEFEAGFYGTTARAVLGVACPLGPSF